MKWRGFDSKRKSVFRRKEKGEEKSEDHIESVIKKDTMNVRGIGALRKDNEKVEEKEKQKRKV